MPPSPRFRLLDGPPVALPGVLDRASERWWAAGPRGRTAVVVVALLALVGGLGARVASSPYGAPVEVLVAAHDLAPGDAVTDAALQRRSWPQDLAPPDAVTGAGGTAIAPVPAGSVVTDRHVGEDAVAAALPDDHVAVPVPAELVPPLLPGTRVDLVGTDLDQRPVALATGAVVVGEDAEVVWIAVPDAAGVAVAGAARRGELLPVVRP